MVEAANNVKNRDKYLIYYEYRPVYFLSLNQEKTLNDKVRSLVSSLSLKDFSDYDKAKEIYHYICHNVSYDWYRKMSSYHAYGALTKRKAVCQGFAMLFYYFGKEAGLNVGIQ